MIRPVTPSESSSRYSTNRLSIAADERLIGSSVRYPAMNQCAFLVAAAQKVTFLVIGASPVSCVWWLAVGLLGGAQSSPVLNGNEGHRNIQTSSNSRHRSEESRGRVQGSRSRRVE